MKYLPPGVGTDWHHHQYSDTVMNEYILSLYYSQHLALKITPKLNGISLYIPVVDIMVKLRSSSPFPNAFVSCFIPSSWLS